jgi:tetratricopeptide (TPR) repeat protein
MIQAKIYSRMGMEEQSLNLYRRLRILYPEDLRIWRNYIWALTDGGYHEEALAELRQLTNRHPDDLQSKKIMASVLYDLGRHTETYAIFEEAIRANPSDIKAWKGYARNREAAGDWAGALICWQEVVHLDDTQESAGRRISSLLRDHRPRLFAEYRYDKGDSTDTIEGDSSKDTEQTFILRYRQHISTPLRLEFLYFEENLEEEDVTENETISSDLEMAGLRLLYNPSVKWEARAGVGHYWGLGDSETWSVSLERALGMTNKGFVRLAYDYHLPWTGSISAAEFDGYIHRGRFSFGWNFPYGIDLRFRAERQDRYVLDDVLYGQRDRVTVGLFKNLVSDPQVYVGYQFKHVESGLEDENFAPISLDGTDTVHSLIFYGEVPLAERVTLVLEGSARRDFVHDINYWSASPRIRSLLGDRVELTIGYRYSDEADNEGLAAVESTENEYFGSISVLM